MNTFADVFDLPVNLEIDGKTVAVPLLTTRDYLPWLEQLTAEKRERDTKLIPAGTKPIERFQMMRDIAVREITPDDLGPLVFTAAGTIKVLEKALEKAGLDKPTIDRFIDSRPAKANEKLAVRLSGLYSATRYAEIYGLIPPDPETIAGAVPNAPAAAPEAAG